MFFAFELNTNKLEIKRPLNFIDNLLPGIDLDFYISQAVKINSKIYLFDEEKERYKILDLKLKS